MLSVCCVSLGKIVKKTMIFMGSLEQSGMLCRCGMPVGVYMIPMAIACKLS